MCINYARLRVCTYRRGHYCLFLLGGLAGTFEKRMSRDEVPRFFFIPTWAGEVPPPDKHFKSMGKTMDYYQAEYLPLVTEFVKNVETNGIHTDGLPEPHLPTIGKTYEQAKYKFAFFGKDTRGFCNLTKFIATYHEDPQKTLYMMQDALDEGKYLSQSWRNRGISFWDIIIKFLCKFYHAGNKEEFIKHYKNDDPYYRDIASSFVWGNTNSVERFYVTAAKKGGNRADYEKIKGYSRIFDNAYHILKTAQPNVLVILNWSERRKWLTEFQDPNDIVKRERVLDEHLEYYYIRSTDTHVFWTAHPVWFARKRKSFEKIIIRKIIETLREYNVWDSLPTQPSDWCLPAEKSTLK